MSYNFTAKIRANTEKREKSFHSLNDRMDKIP